MPKIVSAAAAAALLFATPVMAADQALDESVIAAPGQQEHAKTAAPQDKETAEDDDIQVVIMGKGMHVQVPNPYKNPRPRMLTDAWAMRA